MNAESKEYSISSGNSQSKRECCFAGAGEENSIKVADEAVKVLSEKYEKKRKKRWLFPKLLK